MPRALNEATHIQVWYLNVKDLKRNAVQCFYCQLSSSRTDLMTSTQNIPVVFHVFLQRVVCLRKRQGSVFVEFDANVFLIL